MTHPVVHFEILSSDPDALSAFFHEAFGWHIDGAHPGTGAGGVPRYLIVRPTGEESPNPGINGGIGATPQGYDGHVTFYIRVPDVEAALQKVQSLGAERMMGPDRVPNGPVIGLFTDPQGHVIGLVQPEM